MRILLLLTMLLPALTIADTARFSEPSAIDLRYMQDRRDELNNVAQQYLGRYFSGAADNDMHLMQQLLDRKVVRRDQTGVLQGMGYVLGDILIQRHQGVRWVIYEDKVGRSRALQVNNKPDVVFPATAISRRYEVGADVDVQAVYDRLEEELEWIKQRFYVR